MRRVLVSLLCACALLPLALSAAPPRQVVEQVATTIEREYFDAGRGHLIAAGLREAAGRGDFDRPGSPHELATALTDRLKPQDGHFAVRWSGPAPEPAARRGPADNPAASNFGIRRVEVLPGNVGYLDLGYFADIDFDDAADPARAAIDAALQVLAHVDALLVDVRDNGGGSPAMVGYLSSAFVAPDADIYNTFHWRQGSESEAPARKYARPRTSLPLYVLTSGRTGSAAESLAYTLGNVQRAVLVGEVTGGAANPGQPFDAGAGFSVFVPTGAPVSPVTGTNWEGTGVRPHVQADAADALGRAQELALARLVEGGAGAPARWALEALRSKTPAPDEAAARALAGEYGAVRVELAGGSLQLRQGRRPPLRLRALGPDLFHIATDPTRRVRFERDDGGTLVALELLWADGQLARHPRGAAAQQ